MIQKSDHVIGFTCPRKQRTIESIKTRTYDEEKLDCAGEMPRNRMLSRSIIFTALTNEDTTKDLGV